tara:strand:+ start:38 stop:709 length:672 start_codon:yes stop_codon:yes gene_type:complete
MSFHKFNNKKTWLFDLDNTLYPPNTGIFAQIDIRMKKFISENLKISEDKSFNLQKKFYKQYGTTLYGLIKNYNIDPDEFCDYVHNINFKNLIKSKELKKKLQMLPGRKIVYTNGDYAYAEKVLNSLGIREIFFDIFDIKKTNFIPKPMKTSLNKLIKTYKLVPEQTVYFDDLEKNLQSASSKGFTTIHISENYNMQFDNSVDFRFKTIINALDMIIKVLNVKE